MSKRFLSRILHKILIPVVPPRYKLPILFFLHTHTGCEPELQYLEHLCQTQGAAVDIGANIGLYSYKMSKMFSKVYSFEINYTLLRDLRAYNPGNIEVISTGLSSSARDAILYIPVLNGLPLTGWASLSVGNCPDTDEHIQKNVRISTLDSFNIRSISLVKIDVEGHEIEVLRGAEQTIASCRPVVLIEVRPQNQPEVFSYFNRLGYALARLEDFVNVKGAEGNFIFVPSNRV